ncbi:MAG: biopolymer transporter ExbD [Saprospiraceae bacterium]|nr:biopolymer transporter ExbD [Saprospiraceae bacterium]
MALRTRKRELSEVNMSSMTDIIFFLLIFFMLTSTLVKFHYMELPKSGSRAKAPKKIAVELTKDGKAFVEGTEVPVAQLESKMREEVSKSDNTPEHPLTVTIAAEVGVPFKKVSEVMVMANKLKIKAILATDPGSD